MYISKDMKCEGLGLKLLIAYTSYAALNGTFCIKYNSARKHDTEDKILHRIYWAEMPIFDEKYIPTNSSEKSGPVIYGSFYLGS